MLASPVATLVSWFHFHWNRERQFILSAAEGSHSCTTSPFESVQLLTGFGFIDADDLILNTVGGIIGYVLYRLTSFFWRRVLLLLIAALSF